MELGLTQKELAKRTGLTERTIQRIENHEVEPSVYSLDKIGAILNLNLNAKKLSFKKRNKRILQIIMLVWTLVVVFNLLTGIFTWKEDWWALIIWLICLLGIFNGDIKMIYPKKY